MATFQNSSTTLIGSISLILSIIKNLPHSFYERVVTVPSQELPMSHFTPVAEG